MTSWLEQIEQINDFHRHKQAVRCMSDHQLQATLATVQGDRDGREVEVEEENRWLINRELAILEVLQERGVGPFSGTVSKA